MSILVNISDVCSEIFAGGDAPKSNMSDIKTDEYGIPIFSNGEANDGLYGYTNFARVTQPSITVSARGTIGFVAVRNEPFVPIVRLISLTPNSEKIEIKYLYYALQNYKFDGSGTSIPQLTVPMLKKYSFPLRTKQQQLSIIARLDNICNLIVLRKLQLSKLDELVKSRFVELFGGEKYAKKPIREFVDRKIASARKTYGCDETIHYIDISSIDNKANVVTGTTEYIMTDAPSRAQQCIQYGDILISTVRPNLRNIARNDYSGDKYVASSGFCVLRAKNCDTRFLLCAVLADDFTNAMTEVTTGANYPAIKDSDVLGYLIPVPPIELQEQFAAFVEQVDKSKFEIQKSLEKLETLKKALMQKYFG